jgi:hypothetical protein
MSLPLAPIVSPVAGMCVFQLAPMTGCFRLRTGVVTAGRYVRSGAGQRGRWASALATSQASTAIV